jgi:uncharacterized membrane protein YphA (DoxX/SURF4 family)
LQRLYSTFARGWPGAGLLCLRLTAAVAAFRFGAGIWGAEQSLLVIVSASLIGLLLSAGLWTPIAGGMLAALAVWTGFRPTSDPWAHLFVAGISVALAFLGPGAFSIDARLFGRKRLIHEP